MIDVMELIGKAIPLDGSPDRKLLNNNTFAPINTLAGTNVKWLLVLNNKRAKCGTTIPTKPMGPQKAVTAPASIPAITIIMRRKRTMFIPKVVVKFSPIKKAFNALLILILIKKPINKTTSRMLIS